jgi:hypothetical protein
MKKIQAKTMTMIKMTMILNQIKVIIIHKREGLNRTKMMKLRNHTELKE